MIEIRDLHSYFYTDAGVCRAVEGASFDIQQAETLALVGESGCGKTVSALSIMRLLPAAGRIVQGEIIFRAEDLLKLSQFRMRCVRGKDIGMIFQEPMSALNPLYSIGYQISEAVAAHKQLKAGQIRQEVLQLLERVEMPHPEQNYLDFPHSLSGGLRQRAMIAQGLAGNPELLIADEPTTALDVTIQAEILKLFSQLKKTKQISILLITHDLGIVAEIADRVCVMYAGRIVEGADVFTIFDRPKHPYTQMLLASIPARSQPGKRLSIIPGAVPHPAAKPAGCVFHPRCHRADARCRSQAPVNLQIEPGHWVSCWQAK